MRIKTFALSALAATFMVGIGHAADAPAKPAVMSGASAKMLAQTCEGCHGTNGVSQGPASPSLAGMSVAYIKEAMAQFASGDTKSTVMGRIAKGYTPEEVEKMGSVFANQKMAMAKQSANSSLASNGKKLHKKYCEKCHSEEGTVAADDSGQLKGQWMPYLQYTLEDFKSGDRVMPKKMKKKFEALVKDEGDKGVEALINYYGSHK
jgi:sulfide dehydrogenase cytochrome subunit